jgi:hypothetical protein
MIGNVVCVEMDIGVDTDFSLLFKPKWMRQGKFGLERPAIGTRFEDILGMV